MVLVVLLLLLLLLRMEMELETKMEIQVANAMLILIHPSIEWLALQGRLRKVGTYFAKSKSNFWLMPPPLQIGKALHAPQKPCTNNGNCSSTATNSNITINKKGENVTLWVEFHLRVKTKLLSTQTPLQVTRLNAHPKR
jgi:uncharacterized protein YhhL (DUF1145 family)